MIITCPECLTRFVVSAEAIGSTGRRVRCAKCRHDWHHPAPSADEMPHESIEIAPEPIGIDSIPDGSNLPSISEKQSRWKPVLALCASVILLLMSLLYVNGNRIVQRIPSLSPLYASLGIFPTNGLTFEQIETFREANGNYEKLLITGAVRNVSGETRHQPLIKISLIDSETQNPLLTETITLATDAAIAPDETIPFAKEIARLPQASGYLVLDLGNALEITRH